MPNICFLRVIRPGARSCDRAWYETVHEPFTTSEGKASVAKRKRCTKMIRMAHADELRWHPRLRDAHMVAAFEREEEGDRFSVVIYAEYVDEPGFYMGRWRKEGWVLLPIRYVARPSVRVIGEPPVFEQMPDSALERLGFPVRAGQSVA